MTGVEASESAVWFGEYQRVLRLYTEAIAGRRLSLLSTSEAPSGLQIAGHDLPTWDGETLYLPACVDELDDRRWNFIVFKIAILHQLGYHLAGTVDFTRADCDARLAAVGEPTAPAHAMSPGGIGALGDRDQVPDDRGARDRSPRRPTTADTEAPADAAATSELGAFFERFARPELARGLFAVLEDTRIDAWLDRRYAGVRAELATLMEHSLRRRPDLGELRGATALCEALVRLSLGDRTAELEGTWRPEDRDALGRLSDSVKKAGADVYDSAIATGRAYRLAVGIEKLRLRAAFAGDRDAGADDTEDPHAVDARTKPEEPSAVAEPPPVPFRGAFQPELLQKQILLTELEAEIERLQREQSFTAQALSDDLADIDEVEITSVEEGATPAGGMPVTDLEIEPPSPTEPNQRRDLEVLRERVAAELEEVLGPKAHEEEVYVYNEWDHVRNAYRRDWCRLHEQRLVEEDPSRLLESVEGSKELQTTVQRLFGRLKPELLRKLTGLVDGEEIDLDRAVEARVDRLLGTEPSENLYVRRQKRERDVAAAFLVDMSASTDSELPDPPSRDLLDPEGDEAGSARPKGPDYTGILGDEDDWTFFANPEPPPDRRKVIDVEKEAVLLMSMALHGLGDAYAVYGFSGFGRDQVDFFVAKDFDDRYGEPTRARIAAMKPQRSTRMGPAIRHTIRRLERQPQRLKVLLILSDGYPQDFDYGEDRSSREYGLRDTTMALREAHLAGIHTFCITVDPAGHDYLREMCPDRQYLVIDDVGSLPAALPKVYHGLTT